MPILVSSWDSCNDTPANLRLLSDILKAEGSNVRPAPSGPLALCAARNSAPDLVLLDIDMPGMNGYEVCRQLKADEELASGMPQVRNQSLHMYILRM